MKRMLLVLLMALPACADLSGPTPEATGPLQSRGEGDEASARARLDLNALRAELLAVDAGYAQAAANTPMLHSIPAMLAEDVVYLHGGRRIMESRDSVVALLRSNPAYARVRETWRAVRADVSSDGTHGYTYGYGTQSDAQAGTALPVKYMAYWKRQTDGEWKVAVYVRSGAAPGAPQDPPAGFATPTYKHYRYFPNTEVAAEREEVARTDREFSAAMLTTSRGEAFRDYAAPDGALMSGLPSWVWGPDAIYALTGPGPRAVAGGWAPVIVDVASSGDLAYTVGNASITTEDELGVRRTGYSKYLSIWKKQPTGEWRYVADGGNGRPSS